MKTTLLRLLLYQIYYLSSNQSHRERDMSNLAEDQWKLLRQMAGTVFPNVYFRYAFLDDTECITVTMLEDPDLDANGPNTVVRHDEAWFNVLPRLKLMETQLFGRPHLGS